MKVDSILMSLDTPAKVATTSDMFGRDSDLSIGGIEVRHGYVEDLSFPDILIDAPSRTFAGLSLAGTRRARELLDRADSSVVSWHDSNSEIARRLYLEVEDEVWMHVQWACVQNLTYVPAQLDQILFYYPNIMSGNGFRPIAFQLWNLNRICQDHGLILPDLSAYPALKVNSIGG